MSMKEKITRFIDKYKRQYQRGVEVTQQMKAEKMRQKMMNSRHYQPGSIRYGLAAKQSPTTFMKELYEIKKQEREEKYGKKN